MTIPADEIAIGREAEALLVIGAAVRQYPGSAVMPARLSAPGLEIHRSLELEGWSNASLRLAAFFEDLATHWDGWVGEKVWEDDAATFRLRATHDGKGLVLLQVEVANLPYEAVGTWTARVAVPIEPGALDGISASMRELTRWPA
jgi:hypothetical protein